MELSDFISQDHVRCDVQANSKKRVLEQLSELIAENQNQINSQDVFNSLLTRERLGSTGIGHGIAIPHGRIKHCTAAIGAFIKLDEGVDFDTPDNKPVDMLFALVVPEESTDEHLQILSLLASMFNDESFRETLRQCKDKDALFQQLMSWKKT